MWKVKPRTQAVTAVSSPCERLEAEMLPLKACSHVLAFLQLGRHQPAPLGTDSCSEDTRPLSSPGTTGFPWLSNGSSHPVSTFS